MDFKELQRLVRQGEGDTLEFKRKVAHPEKIIREAVAFANTKGGDLLIGVDDNGSIPGVKYADEEIFVLNKALFTLCKPKLKFSYDIIPLDEDDNKAVVHYIIEESRKKLHYALPDKEAEKGIAYVRSADKSIKASREVRRIIKLSQRKSNRAFSIEDKEKMLLEYLDQHKHITLSEFQQLSKLNRFKASQILITLTLSGIIEVQPSDKEDIYSLSSSSY